MELVVGDALFVEKQPNKNRTLKGTLKLIWKDSRIHAANVEKLSGPVIHLMFMLVPSTETNLASVAGHKIVSISMFFNVTTNNKKIISGLQWPFKFTFQ